MLHKTLTLSAVALVAAFISFGAARAVPIAAATVPVPAIQSASTSGIELAAYRGGRRYYPRAGGYHGGRRYAYRAGYRHGYYRGGRYYGGRYYRPGVGVAVGAALAAPYYGGGYYGNARWCVNRYGRRYICGYY